MNYKVYVTLGFHINFYHSWRGDTPDDAGFGTDIRVIREIIKTLDQANAAGLQARGYWDTEVYWTFQEILPKYSPDILASIRRRVDTGVDEIVLGPFNNGANHAATREEFRASVAWAIENEWGSGLKQLFGKIAPFYRPQETMFTVGQESILKECGVEGIMLYYAGVPFNTISNFIPRLEDEQRYNPIWFRGREEQPPLILLPCIAAGDLIENISLENLILNLHQKQLHGEIHSDVIININEDADLETWLPSIKWLPNMGGLEEYINIINKYPWAEFTLPSEYIRTHTPSSEIIVRQDLADGGYDGNYSWAEKCASIRAWTLLEQSRLTSLRATTLAKRAKLNLDSKLWNGMDSSFFQRLIGLTTTHFGMSTPIINEERQNKAFTILGKSLKLAEEAEHEAAVCLQEKSSALYDFEIYPTPTDRDIPPISARVPVSLPIILPAGVTGIKVDDGIKVSLTDLTPLADGQTSAQLRFETIIEAGATSRIKIQASTSFPTPSARHLKNSYLNVQFSEPHGIESLVYNGITIGIENFLKPFVTYGKKTFFPTKYEFMPLEGESWNGLRRVRLKTIIPMDKFTNEFIYTFTLFDELPYLLVDVEARYALTPKRQVIHNLTQKLRRLIDLQWIETAPFQLTPDLTAPILRIWKHNYMGITSFYDLNYAQINPKNRELASFNHQVTAGWVAVSNGRHGLLVGENAQTLSSMAFCPMRLYEKNGQQTVSLNPFGSYYGNQFDYSHLGGNGNGTKIMQAFSGALAPNGPSFNGETLQFSLLLAPYSGDEPPQEIQNSAATYFYAPGVIVHSSPKEINAVTLLDIRNFIFTQTERIALEANSPLHKPMTFMVNPSPNAVDLVWDAPRNEVITGYEIGWKYEKDANWQTLKIDPLVRWHIDGLENGKPLTFKIRSLRYKNNSAWTDEQTCVPGAVTDSSVLGMLGRIPLWTLAKILGSSLWSLIRAKFQQ